MFESMVGYQVTIGMFAGLLLAAAVSDVISHTIPNKIVVTVLLLYPVLVLVSPFPVDWVAGIAVFGVTLAVGFVLFATKIFGAGDAKLLAATMLWAGPKLAPLALLICTLLGGLLALLMLSRVRFVVAGALSSIGRDSLGDAVLAKHMPYGVPIALSGIFVGWVLLTMEGHVLSPAIDAPMPY